MGSHQLFLPLRTIWDYSVLLHQTKQNKTKMLLWVIVLGDKLGLFFWTTGVQKWLEMHEVHGKKPFWMLPAL